MTLDPRRAAVVAAAVAQIGPGDKPLYWTSCGAAPDTDKAWCGAFTLYCLHQAGLALEVKWIFGIGYAGPQHLALTRNPQPGDIMYKDKPWQHYGVVESWDGKTLVTIEGNTPTVAREVHTDLTGLTFYSIGKFLGEDAPVVAPTVVPPSASPSLLRGIDVSHHQLPSAINYAELAKTHRFVIARATYGSKIDETFATHVQCAQDVGLVVGAYGFYRASQPVPDQLDAFAAAVGAAGMGAGWLPPALDVESNQQYDGPVTTDRYAPAEQLLQAWRDEYGAAMVYTNISTASEIGLPAWLGDYLLWIAHFDVQHPTTPRGMPWTIWQHHVGVLPGVAPGQIDQSVAPTLPLLREHDPAAPLQLTVDWDSLRADRDAMIQEEA